MDPLTNRKKEEILHLKIANDLTAELRPWNRADYLNDHEIYKQIEYDLSDSQLIDVSNYELKPVFIISTPRSGTTLLEKILSSHPEVDSIGESSAFNSANRQAAKIIADLFSSPDADEDLAFSEYIKNTNNFFTNHFKVANRTSKHLVDKSFDNKFLVGQILLTFPNAKIINLTRDPLTTCLSCYKANFAFGNEFSFDLDAFPEYYKIHHNVMSHWNEKFPDSVLTVSYEDLVNSPEKTLRFITEFCEIPWDDILLHHHKVQRTITTHSAEQANKPIYKDSLSLDEEYMELLAPVKNQLEKMNLL